ncbi:MAG: hypothetical protein NC489_23550 [Ruminococcus flavefaciens]|nr:hypothetical protein [Ruminococcus flavefaciens]
MNLTEDQQYFMSILQTAGFIRPDQVLPLLRINYPRKELPHAEALLRRLRYLGLLARSVDGLVCLPELLRHAPDRERLLSLDILIALKPERLLQISLCQPYSLCFLLQRADGWIDHFAVIPAPAGQEARISQLLQAEPKNYIFLLPLESIEQYRQIVLTRSHFFILRQHERLRFYKGGEAGKQS